MTMIENLHGMLDRGVDSALLRYSLGNEFLKAGDAKAAIQFVLADPSHLLITSDRHLDELRRHLAGRVEVLAEAPYFMKKEQLLLLGHAAPAYSARRAADGGQMTR